MRKIKHLYENWRLSKYYNGIRETPMYNWVMLYEEKDFSYLSKSGKLCKRVANVYEKINDQLIDTFGINEDLLKVLNNKTRIEILYAEQVETGDRSNQIYIDILEIETAEMQSQQTKTDFYQQTFEIQKHVPYRIDLKAITMFEYYTQMKIIANKVKHESK
jgi:hypothetical protein